MKKIIVIILIAASAISLEAQEKIRGGILDDNVNSSHEDYAPYMVLGADYDTLFFTSSRPVKNRRAIALPAEIFFSTRPSSIRGQKPVNEGWSNAERIITDASRMAEFTRGSQTISGNRIIFAAERDLSTETAEGTSYLFDLWEMTRTSKGFSLPQPIEEVNDPDAWDSQPALSPDGKVLYFVTNRDGGEGGLDIWYSIRSISGEWTEPQSLDEINTPGDEVSPHPGADGKFYFSSNWDYSNDEKSETGKDIYRAEYQDADGIGLPLNPVNLDIAVNEDAEKYGIELPSAINYNSDKDDEFPFITPDRKYIFLTSNRDASYKKRNIYGYSMPESKVRLIVNVSEEILDAHGNVLEEMSEKKGLPLNLIDNETDVIQTIKSGEIYEIDENKNYTIEVSRFVEEECYSNKIEGGEAQEFQTVRPFGPDTLYRKNIYITRQQVEISPVVFHSTDTLPYFITGYWYPNTSYNLKEFRRREASGFFNQTGFVDSTGYDYGSAARRIDEAFRKKIYRPLERLLPLFQDLCRDDLFLKVTIHGYTDPRGLSAGKDHPYRPESENKRNYPDKPVMVGLDERGNPAYIPSGLDMWRTRWEAETQDGKELVVRLPDEGQDGNIVLSKLRAYYTFQTFDQAMMEQSKIYKWLRDNERVILDAEGYGIDKEGYEERGLRDDPQSRRIEIYLDVLRPEELSAHKRLKGGKLKGVQYASKEEAIETKENEEEIEMPEPEVEITEDKSTDKEKKFIADNTKEAKLVTTINEEQNKPLPVPEAKVVSNVEAKEKNCYSLQYHTYDSEEKAEEAADLLSDKGIADVRVVTYFDPFGSSSYRLRSGCYKSAEEAIDAIDKYIWAPKALNLNKRPVVVR